MALIVKEKDGKQEEWFFSPAAFSMIMHIAEMNGWTHNGKDSSVFSKEISEDLCSTLAYASCEIEESLSPIEEEVCNDCYLKQLVKHNQVELIDEFLWFCDGNPFTINFEN